MPPVEKIKDLQRLLNMHNEAMRAAQNKSQEIYDWHSRQADSVRTRLMARYKAVDKRQPSEEVKAARNSRWRHTGAIGSIHWATSALSGLSSLPTASDEARQLAQKIVNDLWRLKELMGTKQ